MSDLPHADLKELYFQDWRETEMPWMRWQLRDNGGEPWRDAITPLYFMADKLYRRKPRTILINGHEVPEPMRVEPEDGDTYYVAAHDDEEYVWDAMWRSDDTDKRLFARGLLHSTPEAAAAHGKALASFTARDES